MHDGTDDHEDRAVISGVTSGFGQEPPEVSGGGDAAGDAPRSSEEEELSIYHSGRVRIIGAEPAGDTIREVTGPVVDEHPDLQHWNDVPTGQVPAVLDRSNGEEPAMAPPTWREESTDWDAHEDVFEPAMLSEDLPPVGALAEERDEIDVERQPWHFESDDTLVIPPEPGTEPEPVPEAGHEPDRGLDAGPIVEPEVGAAAATGARAAEPNPRHGSHEWAGPETTDVEPELDAPVPERPSHAAAASSDLTAAPSAEPRRRATRAARPGGGGRAAGARTSAGRAAPLHNGATGAAGTSGRDMRVAIGSGVLLGIVALVCFAMGTVATMVIVSVVVLLATAEAYAAFRRSQFHPATLLGLVAVLSLLIETYNKGVAALPLVLVLLVAGSFVWYLARVEPAAEPVSGITSTVFVFVWVGVFGSFAALLLNPNLFPDRHGIAFILAAVIVTVADDVASLLVGSAMGRHQLAPSVSPNKSWEGFLGGAIAAVLVSVIVVHFIHPWTIGKAALYGLVVAVVAPLGDLSQSMIKRHLGLKDMGRLLPGHGGVLDRVDGLLFVIPATYFVVKALHLG